MRIRFEEIKVVYEIIDAKVSRIITKVCAGTKVH
ncbi:Uncharacterised protein [[Clostridium] sordellii]|nr:Uncharacterised protein [[Clostridium] sordellii] [Paeniclostridium sordellii]